MAHGAIKLRRASSLKVGGRKNDHDFTTVEWTIPINGRKTLVFMPTRDSFEPRGENNWKELFLLSKNTILTSLSFPPDLVDCA